MHYNIMINEKQRLILKKALRNAVLNGLAGDVEEREETELMVAMLKDIPATEAESPGLLHGLCL